MLVIRRGAACRPFLQRSDIELRPGSINVNPLLGYLVWPKLFILSCRIAKDSCAAPRAKTIHHEKAFVTLLAGTGSGVESSYIENVRVFPERPSWRSNNCHGLAINLTLIKKFPLSLQVFNCLVRAPAIYPLIELASSYTRDNTGNRAQDELVGH